jgi:hypothetical protein
MSTRYEYVPAIAVVVEYTNEDALDVDDPTGPDVLVLWYDEAIVIPGSRQELADLVERISAALGLVHDAESSASRQYHIDTGRYLLHPAP